MNPQQTQNPHNHDPDEKNKRMTERVRPHEVAQAVLIAGAGLALLSLSTLGFSNAIKDAAYERQKGLCPICGGPLNHRHAEGHHAVPQSLGGNNSVDNCLDCHGQRDRTDCHEVVDRAALDRGMIFIPPAGPMVPINEAPTELFKNEAIRQKSLRRFNIGEAISGTIQWVGGQIIHKEKHRKKHKNGHHKGNKGRR